MRCGCTTRAGWRFSRRTSLLFSAALTSRNHTLKRALTDPRLLSGNRERLFRRDPSLRPAVASRLDPETGATRNAAPVRGRPADADVVDRPPTRGSRWGLPAQGDRVLETEWLCTDAMESPVLIVARRSSAFATRKTRRTIARRARPEVGCWPIARFPVLLKKDWPRTLEELEALGGP